MAPKTGKKNKRITRTPHELLQAEYEKSQLRRMAEEPAPAPPMEVIMEQGAYTSDEPEPLPSDGALVLTVAEVCALLKISRRTLERSTVPGKVKIGGSVRYHRETIEHWLKQQMQPSP